MPEIRLKIVNKDKFEKMFSKAEFQKCVKKGVKKNVKQMQKIMYDATPIDTTHKPNRHPGALRNAWIKSPDGIPTHRTTSTKDGGVHVFLYNRAKDQNGKPFAKAVNNGHISMNQYGGPYPTIYGTGWVPGIFFVERGENRLKEDRSLTRNIENDIAMEMRMGDK